MEIKADTQKAIWRASLVSVIGNAVLSIAKLAVGIIGCSQAVVSDGIDSAADVAISIVLLYAANIINRPPDARHAFGHTKAESIATKVLSVFVFLAGAQIFYNAVVSIVSPTEKEMPADIVIYVTLFSVISKLFLALYQTSVGRRYRSDMLIANGINMRNDVITSSSVLLGLVFTFVFELPILDSVTALLVSALIMKSAVGIFAESNVELMDGVEDPSIYDKIFKAVEQVDGAQSPHRVRCRMIDKRYAITLDIEVDGESTVNQAHELSHRVEESIRKAIPEIFDINIHIEPIGDSREHEAFGFSKEKMKEQNTGR